MQKSLDRFKSRAVRCSEVLAHIPKSPIAGRIYPTFICSGAYGGDEQAQHGVIETRGDTHQTQLTTPTQQNKPSAKQSGINSAFPLEKLREV